jgi:general secretion pathway protein C
MNLLRIDPVRANRVVDGVAILLAVSVALALAGLTWRIVAGGGRDHVAVASIAPPRPPVDVSVIAKLEAFGTPGTAGGASGPTSLPLILKAIFYRESPGVSTAVIGANGQPAKPIAAGESVAGLATVAAIERDHVVVNAGGQLQQLFFPGKMKTLLGQAQAAGQASPPPAPSPPLPLPTPGAPPPAGQSIAPGSLPPPLPSPSTSPRQGAFLDSPPPPPTSPGGGDRAPGESAPRVSVQSLASR